MGNGIKALGVIVVLVVAVAGGMWLLNATPQAAEQQAATMVIDFTAIDFYAGGADAATSAVGIYRLVSSDHVLQETVTITGAATASSLTYTSLETIYLKLYDATDTSICTQFVPFTVPLADPSEIYGQAFQVRLNFVDKGDTAKDILIQYHNNTAIAASATLDVTNESWDSSYAELDLEIRALNDDTGYVNTDNFIRGYGNNHYLVMSASGTGYDSFNLLTQGWQQFEKASVRYFVLALSDTDLTRDLLGEGHYDPDGKLAMSLVFDFTGFESGDSVTFTYEYRWYSSLTNFQDMSSWGVDAAATTETVTVQY